VLGDADDRRDPCVDSLVDRVGRKARGHEDHRGVRAGLTHGIGDGVVDGNAFDVLPALARRDACDEVGAVRLVAQAVEAPLGAGQARDDELRVLVDDDRHYLCDFLAFTISFVSCQVFPSSEVCGASSSRTRTASSPLHSVRASHASRSCVFAKVSTRSI
jgi:hypothetical protein